MKWTIWLLVPMLAGGVLAPGHTSAATSQAKQHCTARLVTKKVNSKNAQVAVKVCTKVKARPIASVSGDSTDLNAVLVSDATLGQWCCFEQVTKTFLGPAHFQVKWSVNCAFSNSASMAAFFVVGYDGQYQAEQLYVSGEAGSKHGTTFIDAAGGKRWAFMVFGVQPQSCTYRLTALRL